MTLIISVCVALAYIPLARMSSAKGISVFAISVIYWICMCFVPLAFVRLCYEANWAGILFRTLLAVTANNFITTIAYYLFTKVLFPKFPAEHPVFYMLFLTVFTIFTLICARFLIRERVASDENYLYQNPEKTARVYFCAYAAVFILIYAAEGCFESIIPPLGQAVEYEGIYRFLQYYLILNMFLISAIVAFVMLGAFETLTLQNEKQVIMQMVRDRKIQYEFSKESVEAMSQQAHDLKHKLRALEQIPDDERREKIREAVRSVEQYDSVIRTGHEALDTILTEKSIYCRSRGIRLSCNVQGQLVEKMEVVDLYTLLGNAIDNAIEAVEKLTDPDKKTISLTVRDQDEMLFMQIENYFDGHLQIENGLPVTTKSDKMSHGFGTKSIRAIAGDYGGMAVNRTEGDIFSVEVLIPT